MFCKSIKIFLELPKFAEGLSKYYYDRCNVGVLDLGYPSNMATFGHLFDDLPALLIRRSNNENMIKKVDENTENLVFNDLESFGYVLGYTKLGNM